MNTNFLNITSLLFSTFLYVFITVFVAITLFILLYLWIISLRAKQEAKWRSAVSSLLEEVIFYEPLESIIIPLAVNMLLNKKSFRCFIAAEIIKIKRSLSGDAGANLVRLYKALNLDKDVLRKLSNPKWHVKAQAVKEMAAMEQKQYTKNIFRLTNNPHDLLRIETQCALVDLYGFAGLRFLNVTLRPLSEWQQLLLLQKLPVILSEDHSSVIKWLASRESTITIFALRLISHFKCYQLHSTVVALLDHDAPEVRCEAVKCLQQIFMEETSQELLNHCRTGHKEFELLLIASLKGDKPDIEGAYLVTQLNHSDDDIKFAAAKALSFILPGHNMLSRYRSAEMPQPKKLITQFKSEQAA